MVTAVSQQTFIYVSEILTPCTSHVMKYYSFFFFSIKKLETWAFRQCTKTGGWQDSALRLQLADSELEEEFGNTCYHVAMASTGELALLQKVKCWKKHSGIGSPHSFSLIHLILWYFHSTALNRHMNFDIFFFLKHFIEHNWHHILVSGIQCKDPLFVYFAKCSPQ